MINIVIITDIMSPYQVELFNAFEAHGLINPFVIYVSETSPQRAWNRPALYHDFTVLQGRQFDMRKAISSISDADLVVFSYYRNPLIRNLIRLRNRSGRPWCFWGERPGFNFPGIVGRLYRRSALRQLFNSAAPIWGIGSWAVAGYQKEFGMKRTYYNVPYFSDLTRFQNIKKNETKADSLSFTLLFSGALIKRKGIDLLADAFLRLAGDNDHVRLEIVGDGPLKESVLAKLQPVSGRVVFHGFKQWEDLPVIYQRADLLCAPSRYDGWGLIVPEGLAAGLPVVATDKMGAAIDLMDNGKNGWIIPAGNKDALFETLLSVSKMSKSDLQSMSEAARRSISSHNLSDGVLRFENAASNTIKNWSS